MVAKVTSKRWVKPFYYSRFSFFISLLIYFGRECLFLPYWRVCLENRQSVTVVCNHVLQATRRLHTFRPKPYVFRETSQLHITYFHNRQVFDFYTFSPCRTYIYLFLFLCLYHLGPTATGHPQFLLKSHLHQKSCQEPPLIWTSSLTGCQIYTWVEPWQFLVPYKFFPLTSCISHLSPNSFS